MNPETTTEEGEKRKEQEAAERRLRAHLLKPIDPDPSLPAPQPSSQISETSATKALIETMIQRLDQLGQMQAEQHARAESVLGQMEATMQLAQEMIAQLDDQREQMERQIQQLVTAEAGLIKLSQSENQRLAQLTVLIDQEG